jgi:hypothetical protein
MATLMDPLTVEKTHWEQIHTIHSIASLEITFVSEIESL